MSSILPFTREFKNNIKSILKFLPDEVYLGLLYRIRIKKKLNLKNPKSFNEKIQWLKIHDRKPIYTKYVDKFEVKKIIEKKIGKQYVIPTIGIWDTFDEIDFGLLPDQFVLKCTHDSGGLVVCKDKSKFDVKKARKKINRSLKTNFYWVGREWPYKNIKPKIIAEKYMKDDNYEDLQDYKLMCFSGKVKCTFICSDRNSKDGLKVTFYDRKWNQMPFERHYPKSTTIHNKPICYNEMVELAERLSDGIPFVRVDFYEINGKVYFGELTLYPGGGLEEFTPQKYDMILGSWLDISSV